MNSLKPKKINPREKRMSYLQTLESGLTKNGVVLFDPENGSLDINEEFLTLSANITDIPSKVLGEHLNAFTQQKMYMRTLVGRMEAFVEEAKRKYMKASNPYYRELSSRMSESAKERFINSEADVYPYYEEYMDLTKQLNMLKMQIANIEDAIFLLSREVTRRTGDFNNENRNHNVGRI